MGPRDDRPVDAEVGDHLARRLRRSRDLLVTPVDAEVARAHLAQIAAAAELTARERSQTAAAEPTAGVWAAHRRPGRVGLRPGGLLAGLRLVAASGLAATAAVLGLAIVGALPPTAAQAVAAAVGWIGVDLPGVSGTADPADGAGAGATGGSGEQTSGEQTSGEQTSGAGQAAAALLHPHMLGPLPLPGFPGGVADGRGLMLGRDGGLGVDRNGLERGARLGGTPGERGAEVDGPSSGTDDGGVGPGDPGSRPPEPTAVETDPPGPVDGVTPDPGGNGPGDGEVTEPTPADPDRPGRPDEPGRPTDPGSRDRPEPPGRDGDGPGRRPDAPQRDRSTGSERTGTTDGDAAGSGAVGD